VGDGPGKDAVFKQLKSRAGTLNEIVKSEAAYVQYLTVLMEVRAETHAAAIIIPSLRVCALRPGFNARRLSRCPSARRGCCD
jgi:hypothetical protein